MCGLAGIHRRGATPVPKIDRLANELLLAIQSRGTDATGFLSVLDTGLVQLEKKPIPAARFVHERGRLKRNARTVLLHTRFATVGAKEDPRNAHPVASGTVAAIHNGTIRNATDLFRQHKLKRIGTVDSEIIPALVSMNGWGDKEISDTLGHFQGGAATAIINTEHPGDVILARIRNYPLVYAKTEDVVVWASTREAIERAWRRTYGVPLPVKTIALLEGTVLRVNGTIKRLPSIPQPRITRSVYRPSKFDAADDAWARSVGVRTPSRPKRAKHRAGSGMPRAFPGLVTPAEEIYWEGDTLRGPEDTETQILDMMAEGLTRADAVEILREASEWEAPVDDYDAANAACLED